MNTEIQELMKIQVGWKILANTQGHQWMTGHDQEVTILLTRTETRPVVASGTGNVWHIQGTQYQKLFCEKKK